MANEVAIVSNDERSELARMLGTADNGGSTLARLKVCYDDEDEQGRPLKKGQFYLTDQEKEHFANSVTIRPITERFQWRDWDEENKKYKCQTILVPRLSAEPRDTNGGLRCGKPKSKELKEMPAEEKAKYKSIDCHRQVYCLVSYKGREPDTLNDDGDVIKKGETHTYENVPAMLEMKRSAFMAFEDDYLSTLKREHDMWDFHVKVTTRKEKNGASTYYPPKFEADKSARLEVTADFQEKALAIVSIVDELNSMLEAKYEASFRETQLDNNAANGVIEALEADFVEVNTPIEDDEIPF